MAGFSRQEQLFLATLLRFQRRAIEDGYASQLPKRLRKPLRIALVCMRLAWIFCRTREDKAIPDCEITLAADTVRLALVANWMENHPLTIADLEDEEQALATIDLQLEIVYTRHDSV
jgi:exopolyphosphatase/guanosine-5'-triphosphate,3'-diphosphate pyrophosphatase